MSKSKNQMSVDLERLLNQKEVSVLIKVNVNSVSHVLFYSCSLHYHF